MSAKSVKAGLVLVAFVLFGCSTGWCRASGSSVVIVPARHAILQIALDVVRLRDATLVSYRQSKKSDKLGVYQWDPNGRTWNVLDLEYGMDNVFSGASFAVVLGQDGDVAGKILRAGGWSGPVHAIPTMDMASIANELNKVYRFDAGEWRWLAARYKLDLNDLNAERRRYGKYGPPGSRPQQAPAAAPGSTILDAEASELGRSTVPEAEVVHTIPVSVEKPVEEQGFAPPVNEEEGVAAPVAPTAVVPPMRVAAPVVAAPAATPAAPVAPARTAPRAVPAPAAQDPLPQDK